MLTAGQYLKNRYVICQVLGSGGFGSVYRARDLQFSQRDVAIKELFDVNDTTTEASFQKEAELLSKLKHKGIPEFYGYFPDRNCFYLVMEFIEGEDLDKITSKTSLLPSETEVTRWFLETAGILTYIHSRQRPVIHRDIKPQNIILNKEGQVFLVDFGIARLYDGSKKKDTVNIATPQFCSPEQAGRQQTDTRSDIYSLGKTMYCLLTQTELKEFQWDLKDIRQINPSVSQELADIINKSTAVKREDRYLSAEYLAKDLERHREKLFGTPQETYSTDPSYYIRLGDKFLEEKNYKQAKENFIQAVKLGHSSPQTTVKIAVSRFYTKEKEEMELGFRMLKQLTAKEPDNEYCSLEYGKMLTAQGSFPKAKELFSQLKTKNPRLPDTYLIIARIMHQQGNLSSALKEIDDGLQLLPDNVDLLCEKAKLLINADKLPEAENILDHLPENSKACYLKGIFYRKAENLTLAVKNLRLALEFDNNNQEARFQLAEIYKERNNFSEARELLLTILNSQPDNLKANEMLGNILFAGEFYEEAVLYLEKTCRQTKKSQNLLSLAIAYEKIKHYNKAIAAMKDLLQLKSDYQRGYYYLGRFYLLAGNKEEAVKNLSLAVQFFPFDEEIQRLKEIAHTHPKKGKAG